MLAHRVATALVLLLLIVATLWVDNPWPFACLMLAMVMASAWEWGRLIGASHASALGVALGLGAMVLGSVLAWGMPAETTIANHPLSAALPWWGVAAAWVAGGWWVLRRGVMGWKHVPRPLQWVVGALILWTTWWSIVLARAAGINFMLSAMVLVWASDVFAYFGGKGLGGKIFGPRKLAPSISPGKTWEGAVSGALGAMALALVWVLVVDPSYNVDGPSLYTRLVEARGWWPMALVVVALVTAGIVGDLFESLIKRAGGAKDSSRLLPGHGGVLDRVDALLPVMPMAWALGTAGGL